MSLLVLIGAWLLTLCVPIVSAQVPPSFVLPHDTIPNFAQSPTIVSVQDGSYCAPTTWSPARVPLQNDVAVIRHTLLYDCPMNTVHTIGIEVGGILKWSANTSTQLQTVTILVEPGGMLEIGTPTTPMLPTIMHTIVFRDVPLDTTDDDVGVYDPAQYGTGLLSIHGRVTVHGAAKTPFVRLAAPVAPGATTLTLAQAPQGWRVGDVLVLPDSRQLTLADLVPQPTNTVNRARKVSQSETVVLVAISETQVTLQTPTLYAHGGVADAQGQLSLLPYVGNLTRNIVFISQNPAGVRGHTLFTGTSDIAIRHAQFQSLGRTRAEPLDNTALPHIGTNQIGRYPLHIHHTYGVCSDPVQPYQFVAEGNSIVESGRWGLTVHDSHYGLIKDNVVYNVKGAGIATEDGSETANVFDGNMTVRTENITTLQSTETLTDPLGRRGNGFWLRGQENTFRNNVVADAREGFGLYAGSHESGPTSNLITIKRPNYPCANTTISGQYTNVILKNLPSRTWNNNEIYSTSEFGMGFWFVDMNKVPVQPISQTTVWHVHDKPLFGKYLNGTFDGLVIRNTGGVGLAYADSNENSGGVLPLLLEIKHADISGVDTLYKRILQLSTRRSLKWSDSTLQSRQGIILNNSGQLTADSTHTYHNLRFLPYPGVPLRTIISTNPRSGSDVNNLRRNYTVTQYQGVVGDDFRLYALEQAPSAPAPPPGTKPQGCPVTGLTNQQCWDAHQVATMMALAPCDTTRPEVGGFACATSTPCVPSCPADIPCGTVVPDSCGNIGACAGPVCPPPPTCTLSNDLAVALQQALAACGL